MPRWLKWTLVAILVYIAYKNPHAIGNAFHNIVHSLSVIGDSIGNG